MIYSETNWEKVKRSKKGHSKNNKNGITVDGREQTSL